MSEATAEPNDRGEVTLPLGGVNYHLRPSHAAILAIEEQTGMSLHELVTVSQSRGLQLKQMAIVTAEMMRAYGSSHPDEELKTDYLGAKPQKLTVLIHEAGPMSIQPRLTILLLAALTGGVDASGEWKAVAKKPTEDPATAE